MAPIFDYTLPGREPGTFFHVNIRSKHHMAELKPSIEQLYQQRTKQFRLSVGVAVIALSSVFLLWYLNARVRAIEFNEQMKAYHECLQTAKDLTAMSKDRYPPSFSCSMPRI